MTKRHELKHIINCADYLLLKARLSRLFIPDGHAGAHGEYRVRSLYFDTPCDRALREKTDSVDEREKFRIRLYNGDPSYIRLEKKTKKNGLSDKRGQSLSLLQTQRILDGDIEWLRQSGDPLLIEFYSKIQGQRLQPKTVVEYIRTPFIYPPGNVRITLDREIRSGLMNKDFLNPALPLLNTFEAYAVLEVKYDRFIPDLVLQAVRIPDRRRSAFSKYAVCRKYD